MSDDEIRAVSADTANFIKQCIDDAFPVVAFTAAAILFVYVGFFIVGWL